ncbi:hypothetical protein PVK06_035992 [Gossypium arboreum]|uniref:Uncharacterized protein n=1 Tax=Gossypium arboreum TaxID=29729 RepID=A0ABR0NIB3_GOSAR|nr:hypothetical protein PVK06_035992 [Gossypium arboreum]
MEVEREFIRLLGIGFVFRSMAIWASIICTNLTWLCLLSKEVGIVPALSLVGEFISPVLLEQQVEKTKQILGMLRGISFCRNATVWKQKVLTADQLMHDVDEFLQGWLGD